MKQISQILFYALITINSFSQEFTLDDFKTMALSTNPKCCFDSLNQTLQTEVARCFQTYDSRYSDQKEEFKLRMLDFKIENIIEEENQLNSKRIIIDSSWNSKKIFEAQKNNQLIDWQLSLIKKNTFGIERIASEFYRFRDSVSLYSNQLIPCIRRIIFNSELDSATVLKVCYVLPLINLPEGLFDSLKSYVNFPPVVLAAMGDSKEESKIINQFLSQLTDTINYSIPDKELTYKLFYINSKKTWDSFAMGLECNRTTWEKIKWDERSEGKYLIDYWKKQSFAASLMEQYSEYFFWSFYYYKMFDPASQTNSEYFSFIDEQNYRISQFMKSYIERTHPVSFDLKTYLYGYSLYYLSPLDPEPSDALLVSTVVFPFEEFYKKVLAGDNDYIESWNLHLKYLKSTESFEHLKKFYTETPFFYK
jgi:hypothetical protein